MAVWWLMRVWRVEGVKRVEEKPILDQSFFSRVSAFALSLSLTRIQDPVPSRIRFHIDHARYSFCPASAKKSKAVVGAEAPTEKKLPAIKNYI
jgi:hypothetical protein